MGTVGSWVGGVVGAVVGFYLGGPQGAIIGFGLGFGLGMALDPMSADVPAQGASNKEKITSNIIGNPVFDLLGTSKVAGTFVMYGLEKTKKVKQKSGKGGGGGGAEGNVSYRYYMSWVQAICLGPVDTLYTVYKDNDEIIWEGVLNRPSDGSYETITLDDIGTMRFYFGSDTQTPDSVIAHIINAGPGLPNPDEPEEGDEDYNPNIHEPVINGETLNSPMLGLCYAVFDNCSLGNYSRVPTIKFLIRKTPILTFADGEIIDHFDYNPAHALWYIIHEMTGLPAIWLDEIDFADVAGKLMLEQRGISCLFDQQNSALSYIENVNNHIDGIVRYGSDAKFHPFLLRKDYDADSLEVIDESILLEEPTFSRKSWIETINEVKIQYQQLCWKTNEKQKRDDFYNYPGTTIVDHGITTNILWAGSGQIGRLTSTGGAFLDELGMGFAYCNADDTDTRDLAYIDNNTYEDCYAQATITSPVSTGALLFYLEPVLSKNTRCYDGSFELFVRANPTGVTPRYSITKEMGSDIITLHGDTDVICDDYFMINATYRIEAIGNVLRAYCNGRLIGEGACANRSNGYLGMAVADNKKSYTVIDPVAPGISWGGSGKFTVSYPTRIETPTVNYELIGPGTLIEGPDLGYGITDEEAFYIAPPNDCLGRALETVNIKVSVTWPSMLMTCDDIATFYLPAFSGPPQGTIGYTTLQMSAGEEQSFSILNQRSGGVYTWEATGGSMDGNTFTADSAVPLECPDGDGNAYVILYDCGIFCDSVALAVDYGMSSFPTSVAYREANNDYQEQYACYQTAYPYCVDHDCIGAAELLRGFDVSYVCTFTEYYCDGSVKLADLAVTTCANIDGVPPHVLSDKQVCKGIASSCCGDACGKCGTIKAELAAREAEFLASCLASKTFGDVRTEAMKNAACCPANLL